MAVLNYTTRIAATKTVGEMQNALAQAGASRISTDYEDGRPSALSFMLVTPHGPRHFTLPVNVPAMHRLLRCPVAGREDPQRLPGHRSPASSRPSGSRGG